MIQAVRETAFTAWLSLEDSRIDNSVALSKVRHLFKFINDMDKAVFYAYPINESNANPRYTECLFHYNIAPDIYSGTTKLIPAGYYKYEVYEVTWAGAVTLSAGNAPATEDDVLSPPSSDKGIVQGLVGIGKLYLAEKVGSEQVQYNQHPEPAGTNYIYYGQ
tara:strand:- start:6007 stop:6492 length:486 start_codon:yes stop_codon:yes gene_type:complete